MYYTVLQELAEDNYTKESAILYLDYREKNMNSQNLEIDVKKNILASILITLFTALPAMTTNLPVCHLAKLPTEVRNLIAEYLLFTDRESDTEFIERTTEIGKLPPPLSCCDPFIFDISAWINVRRLASYGIDSSKILLLERSSKAWISPKVRLCDVKKKQATALPDLAQLVKNADDIKSIALSRDGHLVAAIVSRYISGIYPNTYRDREDHLIVRTIASGQGQDFSLPGLGLRLYYDSRIQFNKQSTKVAVSNLIPEGPLWILDLTDQKEHTQKSKKTLDEYLQQHRVCKKVINSLQYEG